MKTFRIEFDEITTHIGTLQANSLKEAKEIVYGKGNSMPNNFEPVIGETKIQFIEEVQDENI
jgi:hypothetical protein